MRALLVAAGFDGELLEQALRVAWCESRYRPGASNGRDFGLFQLDPLWAAWAGVPVEALFDPLTNARVARLVVDYDRATGGPDWRQWQCSP